MFDLINGLPMHPLVVHAVVVLLPLACIGAIAIAVKPSWRERYGVLVVACAAAATVLLPVATSSGEQLEGRVGSPGEHAELGDSLIWFAIPLLVVAAALVWLDRRARAGSASGSGGTASVGAAAPSDAGHSARSRSLEQRTGLMRTLAVLAVVAALATTVQTYRVGDSGARAAWGDKVSSSATK